MPAILALLDFFPRLEPNGRKTCCPYPAGLHLERCLDGCFISTPLITVLPCVRPLPVRAVLTPRAISGVLAASACVRLFPQAEGSWSKERCCAVKGNYCGSTWCGDHGSSSDYLYRLSPGEPERYETIPGGSTLYQQAGPTYWPTFGGGADLRIGNDGPPGTQGYCDQGYTYHGSTNAACGGHDNWGHTDLEVWFI
eukprot:COSAG06_NODE_855_length_11931_cov_20.218813_12_plen_196_part_00